MTNGRVPSPPPPPPPPLPVPPPEPIMMFNDYYFCYFCGTVFYQYSTECIIHDFSDGDRLQYCTMNCMEQDILTPAENIPN